jgi:hypothetical protein
MLVQRIYRQLRVVVCHIFVMRLALILEREEAITLLQD